MAICVSSWLHSPVLSLMALCSSASLLLLHISWHPVPPLRYTYAAPTLLFPLSYLPSFRLPFILPSLFPLLLSLRSSCYVCVSSHCFTLHVALYFFASIIWFIIYRSGGKAIGCNREHVINRNCCVGCSLEGKCLIFSSKFAKMLLHRTLTSYPQPLVEWCLALNGPNKLKWMNEACKSVS